jgi:carbon-monoxide dehydrogenase small subunit
VHRRVDGEIIKSCLVMAAGVDGCEVTTVEIRRALQGNLCRCTGYQKMVDAIRSAAEQR